MSREWGPDESGRWGNNMMALRDDTAEKNVELYRRLKKLIAGVDRGEFTRAGLQRELRDLSDLALRGVLNLAEAGAPVRVEALDSFEVMNRR